MKAATYYGQKDVRIETLETPIAGDNDVVIRNLYASICGTDVAVYLNGPNTGHRITVGSEFGHEMISEVVQVGKNVKGIAVGDIVYPYPRLAKGDLLGASPTATMTNRDASIIVKAPRFFYLRGFRIFLNTP